MLERKKKVEQCPYASILRCLRFFAIYICSYLTIERKLPYLKRPNNIHYSKTYQLYTPTLNPRRLAVEFGKSHARNEKGWPADQNIRVACFNENTKQTTSEGLPQRTPTRKTRTPKFFRHVD